VLPLSRREKKRRHGLRLLNGKKVDQRTAKKTMTFAALNDIFCRTEKD